MGAKGEFKGESFDLSYQKWPPKKATPDNPPWMEFSGTGSGATWRMAGKIRWKDDDPKLPVDLSVRGESLAGLPSLHLVQ